MAIAHGKKRYVFTLDQSDTDKCKAKLSELGAPLDALSQYVDSCVLGLLEDLTRTIEVRRKKGKKTTYEDYERLNDPSNDPIL
jgi:hypothetical protein